MAFYIIVDSATTTRRNGTCYSSTECRDKSGTAAGGCAAGYGIHLTIG